MKKTLIFLLMGIAICLLCTSCPHHFIEYDESRVSGELCYAVNPFKPEDTVICIRNVYVLFNCYNQEYCSDTRDLLSLVDGEMSDCKSHQCDADLHRWNFLANKEQCFYPIYNGQFISLIDTETGRLIDSINLSYRDMTIYTKQRVKGNNDGSKLHMGDFVRFQGSDYMKPKFITDSITPAGERIVCIDGHNGPSWEGPIEPQK